MNSRFLAAWFNRTPFAVKFAVVGLALAGPLLVSAGFAVSAFHGRVQVLRDVDQALQRANAISALAVSVSRHRGLSATVLAGGEDTSSPLVDEQQKMLQQFDQVVALLDKPGLRQTGLANPAGLRVELQALIKLPHAREPGQNFERHNAVISSLLASLSRSAHSQGLSLEQAAVHDAVFVRLPMLIEEIGRQRGWGSAILTLRQASAQDERSFLLSAGAVARRLELMLADPATLERLDVFHGGLGQPVREALAQADVYNLASLAQVQAMLKRPNGGDDDASKRHFAGGTAVVDHLAAVTESLGSALRTRTEQALQQAQLARALALASLVAVLLLLLAVYTEFSRSTVDRLKDLGLATRRLARSEFDQPIGVEGRDEIAQLGQALDEARQLLRAAIAERAVGLAAQAADRAKTDFLARWSHDLRTPLHAVLGFAELLQSRPGRLSESQRGDLQRIQQAGSHLLQLVNDVLDISRIEASQVDLRLAPVGLQQVLADAVVMVAPLADQAAVLVQAHAAELGQDEVLADRTRLLQILGNLLGNAVKFNHPGGRVDVRVRCEAAALVVDVTDTGPGITAEGQRRLFTPFERLNAAERQIQGSGLGLALSQRLAQLMGGHISVQSSPGQGACFSLHLPCAEPGLAFNAGPCALADKPALALAAGALPGRVAYVDDDPVNVILVQEMMAGQAGTHLTVFTQAQQALHAAREGARFDLWLIDKQLPDGDGVSLLQALHTVHTAMPVRAVMLSADAMPSSVAPALAAGFQEYWTKPIALQALREGVARQLALARGQAMATVTPSPAPAPGSGLATMSGV